MSYESFRFDAQMAKRLVHLQESYKEKDRGDYTIFGRPYAQYLRFETEGKLTRKLGASDAQFASRMLIGGNPLRHSSIIPS